jgi:NADH-quinone oxidoreductase subunit L
MLGPLVLLAIGSAAGGFLKIPHVVRPVFRLGEDHVQHVAWLPVAATLTAVAGMLGAYYLYLVVPEWRGSLARAVRPALRVLEAKYFFDDVYNGFVRRVVVGGSDAVLWQRVDVGVIDGLVNGTARFFGAWAERLRPVQTGFVRHYALLVLAGAVALVSYLLWS